MARPNSRKLSNEGLGNILKKILGKIMLNLANLNFPKLTNLTKFAKYVLVFVKNHPYSAPTRQHELLL